MIQYLKSLIFKMKQLWPSGFMGAPLTLIRVTEKFDVVERVPVNVRHGLTFKANEDPASGKGIL